MNIEEIRKILEDKIKETRLQLESAENGDKLAVRTSLSYMDNKCNESEVFIKGTHTMLLGTIFVRSAENPGDEDPEFSYSIASIINADGTIDESGLENEYLEFDSRVIDFIARLKNCTNVEALIAAETALIEEDSKSLRRMVEDRLEKLKRKGIIAGVAVLAIMLALTILKTIIK